MKYFRNGRKMATVDILYQCYSEYRTICKCGHSVVVDPKIGKKLCSFCGHYVYSDKD